MAPARDDWKKVYRPGERFSEATVESIKQAYKLRRKIRDVARELGISSRNVSKYYGYFREEGVERSDG